jgi:hypothetical protein
MDNATNCDSAANNLTKLVPRFLGKPWRIRCAAHIINLIAKVGIISTLYNKSSTDTSIRHSFPHSFSKLKGTKVLTRGDQAMELKSISPLLQQSSSRAPLKSCQHSFIWRKKLSKPEVMKIRIWDKSVMTMSS